MQNRAFVSVFCILTLAVAASSCGGSGTTTPTATPLTTPYPPPTPTPTPTPSPVPATAGNVTCQAPVSAVPGSYFTITIGAGAVVGSVFSTSPGVVSGSYEGFGFATGTPPWNAPTPIPVPTAAPSGTNDTWIVYYGEYTFPTIPSLGNSPTTGCFEFVTEQQLGQTVGQSKPREPVAAASSSPPFAFGFGMGVPIFASPQPHAASLAATGNIASATISNLTRTSGTGTFTTDFGGTGTLTLHGSTLSIGATGLALPRRP